MRILYLVWNYPQISETYVSNEIAFAQSNGFHVEVWSPHVIRTDVPTQCPVHRGSIAQAVEAVKPDLVHMHYLAVADHHAKEVPTGIPMTVRTHSFDWNAGTTSRLAEMPWMKKIYAFPHFARELQHPKVVSLPVAYNTKLHKPSAKKDRKMVLRMGAALPTKGLADFFAVVKEVPEHRFVMAVVQAGGGGDYPNKLRAMNSDGRVDLRFDQPCKDAALLAEEAAIYLDTSDPAGHRFGMPISIAETMATGAFVLARRSPAAEEYLGPAGRLYSSIQEAAALIKETVLWKDEEWAAVSKTAIERAAAFADTAILPRIMEDWKSLK